MVSIKEVGHILIALVLFAFVISFLKGVTAFLLGLVIAAAVLIPNLIAKKLAASYTDVKIENKILHWQRWGYYTRSYFKKGIPVGIIIPFVLSWISRGFISCLWLLQTDVEKTPVRKVKRRGGFLRYAELTEWHTAVSPAMGLTVNLILALLLLIFFRQFPIMLEIAKLNIFYAMWNIFPLGQLDGTKIFFGSFAWWMILFPASVIMTLITLLI